MDKTDNNFYKICPACNFFCHIDEPDEFCSYCGRKLITKCPQCGNKIDNPYVKYCKYSGKPILRIDNDNKKEF